MLPFLHAPVPAAFRRWTVTLDEGRPHPYRPSEWRDALVVVRRGRLHLECHDGGFRRFDEGAVLCLDGLALRALHNRGPGPTVLVAVTRRPVPEETVPLIIELPDRPYLGVRRTCTLTTMGVVADRIPEIIGHLLSRGAAPAGAPFLRYHLIDRDGVMEVEAGVPADDPSLGSGEITAGVLPAGWFAVVRHRGHPDRLLGRTAALLEWGAAEGVGWDVARADAGERWGCRTEHFLTNPEEQPDPNRWETELALRLR